MSNFIRFSLFTFDALSNIFLMTATNSSKQQRYDKSYKIKYKALKENEKGTPRKDVSRMFEFPKNTWKKNKEKIFGNYERRAKPQKYEAVNKAVMKRLLIMRSDNIPINEPMFKEKAHKLPEQLNLEDFHASDGWLKKLEKGYTDLRLSNFLLNTLQ